jgi:transposase
MACLSLNLTLYIFVLTSIIMHSLSQTQKNTILSMLDAGHSAHSIASITGVHASTISRLCSKEHSELQKSTGGRPAKLSPYNIHRNVHFISFQEAENGVQITRKPSSVKDTSIHPNTICRCLKNMG